MMVYAMFEKGVKQNLVGMGSALTIVFLGFVLILTLTQVYFINRKVHYSSNNELNWVQRLVNILF